MQSKLAAAALAATGLTAASASAQIVVLNEDFNDGAASSRWSVISQQEGVVGTFVDNSNLVTLSAIPKPTTALASTLGAGLLLLRRRNAR